MGFTYADAESDLLSVRYRQSVQVLRLDLLELQNDKETKNSYESVSGEVTTNPESQRITFSGTEASGRRIVLRSVHMM
jgi:hypothetical protein